MQCFDVRNSPVTKLDSKALWTLQAHHESVSAFDVNPIIPGFLVTGSTDKQVNLWNVDSTGPSLVVSRNLDVGKVFASTFAPDMEVGFRVAVAGSNGTVRIWDTSTNAMVRRIFADRVATTPSDKIDRVVHVEDGDEDESESEEGQGQAEGPGENSDDSDDSDENSSDDSIDAMES